jgi:hypothetical protein
MGPMMPTICASVLVAIMLTVPAAPAGAQGQPPGPAKVAAVKSSEITHAIEERFRQLDPRADIKLISASVKPGRAGQSVLEVTATPPASQALEAHAQTIYSLVFDSVAQVPGAFAGLTRIRLSLVRQPKGLTTDCPVKVVQDSLGYMSLEALRSKCVVR